MDLGLSGEGTRLPSTALQAPLLLGTRTEPGLLPFWRYQTPSTDVACCVTGANGGIGLATCQAFLCEFGQQTGPLLAAEGLHNLFLSRMGTLSPGLDLGWGYLRCADIGATSAK